MIARFTPWLIAVAAVVAAVAVIAAALRRESERATAQAKAQEAVELRARDQIVALQREKDELENDLEQVQASVSSLRAALEETRKVVPKARVVRVERASTGPVPIDEAALRGLCASLPVETAPEPEPINGEIRVASVDLKTKAGNIIATGAGEAWALNPPRLLFSGPFSAPATSVSVAAPEPDNRWPWYVHEAIGVGAGLVGAAALTLAR